MLWKFYDTIKFEFLYIYYIFIFYIGSEWKTHKPSRVDLRKGGAVLIDRIAGYRFTNVSRKFKIKR